MVLTQDELKSLVELKTRSPHHLLGMHPQGNGAGLVARALRPDAARIELEPVHEKDKPAIQLTRIPKTHVFEGTTAGANKVYAYDLVITDEKGNVHRTRDPYSFLPTLSEGDLYLFGKGDERRIYDKLGSQLRTIDGVAGVSFAVWAPNAQRVSVVGDFNNWDGRYHQMRSLGSSGVWEIFIPGVTDGAHYKYEIRTAQGHIKLKTDPFVFFFETPPKNAAIVWNTNKFEWSDEKWLSERQQRDTLRSPLSIYEVHLGSWRKKSMGESLSYRELAEPLVKYVKEMGFTHVEFMPVAEHAFYPSWGYQVTGFYAPSSRYGPPEDFQFLVNALHEAGIGVIVDWVPAHFPRDDWALARFDGTALYEHEDPRKGAHQDWGTLIFNFGRHEVNNFLVANALFWCERFHIDGLRVDAVASMLYLDYSRPPGEWIPNIYGGRENIDAVKFIRDMNTEIYAADPGAVTLAEESTAWPRVSHPVHLGGLGFGYKWNMGWMHDTLDYMSRDPIHRRYHHDRLTFGLLYAFSENFILPLSHDEVVHGKRSILGRMPGDRWQRFANLRAYYAFMWCHPGKKLIFMGGEFGQEQEWAHEHSLDWHLIADPMHRSVQDLVRELNRLYRSTPALHRLDSSPDGFSWVDANDADNSVLSFLRFAPSSPPVLVVCNFTPVVRESYRVGVPVGGYWRERINTDAACYGGSNVGNAGGLVAEGTSCHNRPFSLRLTLPPLATLIFEHVAG